MAPDSSAQSAAKATDRRVIPVVAEVTVMSSRASRGNEFRGTLLLSSELGLYVGGRNISVVRALDS